MFKGEKIYLRPFEQEDLLTVTKWFSDSEILGLIGENKPSSLKDIEKHFEKIRNDDSRRWFAICRIDNNKLIGECGLLRIYFPWRTSDLTMIIGEKDEWGKGYGREAIKLLLDYAFFYLNLNRIAIGVVGFNQRAIKFYSRIGFVKEGVQRDGYFFNNEYHDFIMMSFLKREYTVNKETD